MTGARTFVGTRDPTVGARRRRAEDDLALEIASGLTADARGGVRAHRAALERASLM
jgi:hypothetical protein